MKTFTESEKSVHRKRRKSSIKRALQAVNEIIPSPFEEYDAESTFSQDGKENCPFSLLTMEFSTHFAEDQRIPGSFFSTLLLEPTPEQPVEGAGQPVERLLLRLVPALDAKRLAEHGNIDPILFTLA